MRLLNLVLLLLILPAFAAAGTPPKEKPEDVSGFVDIDDPTGKPLSDFKGVTVDGREVSTMDMRGKVLLITLWGINCGSCLDELKALEDLYRERKDDGFVVWAVNSEQRNADQIREGLAGKDISVTYPLLVDKDMEITKIFTSWFIPVSVIVDRLGVVQYYKIGFNDSDLEKVSEIVGELLAE